MDNYDFAEIILGKDFISPERIMWSCDGIIYTEEQISEFREKVPQQEIILWCRDNNFMLVAGPNHPMSLLEICTMRNDYFYPKKGKYGWYIDKDFAQNEKVETKWYMICKDIVSESTSKNWEEQQPLISDVETVPNAAEFTWVITTYKAVRDVYLFGNGIHVRTSSLGLDDDHVDIGGFNDEGLSIDNRWNGLRDCLLGLSVARK